MQSNYIPNIDLADIINKDLKSDAAVQVSNNIKKASEEIGFYGYKSWYSNFKN